MSQRIDEFNQNEVWRVISGKPGTWYQEADDSERTEFRNWVRGLLQERKVCVTFTKRDGSTREMTCTLNEDAGAVMPVNTKPLQEVRHEDTACRVWDCEKSEWRSFRWDSVKRIEFKLG